MGKVNACLRLTFIILTCVIAAISILVLGLTFIGHKYLLDDDEIEEEIVGLYTLYIFSSVTLGFSVIGLYGAFRKKDWALITFTVGMILSILVMLGGEIQELARRPQVAKDLKRDYLNMLPLDNADAAFLDSLHEVQAQLQCCGLDQGYLDWGNDIPESCLCAEAASNPCEPAPKNSVFEHMDDGQPVLIYKEPCIPYMIEHEMSIEAAVLGIMLGVTLLWIWSVVLGIVILCQLRRKDDIPAVVYSKEAKAGNYSVFTEAADYT